jgi:dTDP-glucose 4,6-dehydratase
MSFEPHNVLITGGAGFIGTNFVRHWLARNGAGQGRRVRRADLCGHIENLAGLEHDPRYLFVRGDICDEAAVRALLEQHQIDTLVHFAAESHVDRSILGPDDFIRTNVVGTHALLKAAKSAWIDTKLGRPHRFHHVSTDEVYGSLGARRSAVPRAHALCAELAVFGEQGRLRPPGARLPRDLRPLHDGHQLLEQLRAVSIPGKAHSADHHEHPLGRSAAGLRRRAAGARLAARRRSLRGDRLALSRGQAGEVYNIGGNSETTNIEIVRTLCALVDETLAPREDLRKAFPSSPAANGKQATELIVHVRDRPGHDRRYAINYERRSASSAMRRRATWRAACARRSTGIWTIRRGGRRCWAGIMRPGSRRITAGSSCPAADPQ